MLTWTLTTSSFQPTSSMQSILTSRTLAISLGWASIGGIIVGGENRDGNTNVRYHQEDTLRRIMDRVTSELGVVIERFPCRLRVVLKGNHPNRRAALQHVLYTCYQLWQSLWELPTVKKNGRALSLAMRNWRCHIHQYGQLNRRKVIQACRTA